MVWPKQQFDNFFSGSDLDSEDVEKDQEETNDGSKNEPTMILEVQWNTNPLISKKLPLKNMIEVEPRENQANEESKMEEEKK